MRMLSPRVSAAGHLRNLNRQLETPRRFSRGQLLCTWPRQGQLNRSAPALQSEHCSRSASALEVLPRPRRRLPTGPMHAHACIHLIEMSALSISAPKYEDEHPNCSVWLLTLSDGQGHGVEGCSLLSDTNQKISDTPSPLIPFSFPITD